MKGKVLYYKDPRIMTLEELKNEIRVYQFELDRALQIKKYRTAAQVSESLTTFCKLAFRRSGF
ncbi:hypothetical protein Desaci_4773 (plasmid) [Desulfosporosinus acidiphilus SJ4]|uniref:Uncharacterized protein n=1 Tax=Desulfosporosinus acidiphilus (strain DSM 22704 / JCM 16185 / SJ4) TaxID=646529 RepID=I4DCS4_DESAJ|nr:hypothetical protein [Desulfosporosinus acidiphilus]AFM43598.1 hypothetical protein Desaci_4773 [Desulfosporosinus acidiphilus SJ4]